MISRKKIVHVFTVLYKDDMIALKKKTGKSSNMDALAEAARHYLTCSQVPDKK